MRFSDLMGSGGEREQKPDNAIDAAIAPYLDDRSDTETPAPAEDAVEPVEVVAADEPWAPPAPDLPAPPAPPAPIAMPTPTAATPAVASFDVATPVEPEPARRSWQPDRPVAAAAAPVEVHTAATSTATIVADFTPLSDDLLPRRR